jgi:hypothetical protein
MSALLERGVVKPGQTPMAGLSGGAFTSTATTAGMSAQQQFDAWTHAVRMCGIMYADEGGCAGHFNKVRHRAVAVGLPVLPCTALHCPAPTPARHGLIKQSLT